MIDFHPIRQLLATCSGLRGLLVGYSGGVDSHVLLHLLAEHRAELPDALSAVYIDHGLHTDSRVWGEHCRAVCQHLGVVFRSITVAARPAPGQSPEEAARAARYQAFAALLNPGDALLSAHHCDDQAETLLLQLLRGGGPRGLAAMPGAAPLGRGILLRPLLAVRRHELLAYARAQGLRWVEDTSNADQRLDRNYLRHEILPRLERRWPAAARLLARSAGLCAEAAVLIDDQAGEDLARIDGGRPDCVAIKPLVALGEARRRNVLSHWLRRLGLPAPGSAHLRHILRDVVAAAPDRTPCVAWPGCEVRRYRGRLFAMVPLSEHDPSRSWPWSGDAPLAIPGVGRVWLRAVRGAGVAAGALAGKPLTVRFRRGGECFRPRAGGCRRSLKNLLYEAGIPHWERDRTPLLYVADVLVAVAGLGVGGESQAGADEPGWIFEWQKSAASVTF